jgi:hypothetical protein
MHTLLELCLKLISNLNSYYYGKLPYDLLEKLTKYQIQRECSNCVSQIIQIENSRKKHVWLDYFEGIIRDPQEKYKRYLEIKGYELSFNNQNYYHYFPKIPYILYYLKQEPDYEKRYPQKSNAKIYDLVEKPTHYCLLGVRF